MKGCHKVREQIERGGNERERETERANMQTGNRGDGEGKGGKVRERCGYG